MSNMGTVTTSLLTFEEFERLPIHDQPGKRELLDGELIQLPVPELEHSEVAQHIFLLLRDAVDSAHGRGEAAEVGKVYIRSRL